MAFAWFPRLGEFPSAIDRSQRLALFDASTQRQRERESCIGVAVLIETKVLAYRFDSRFPIELTIKLNR